MAGVLDRKIHTAQTVLWFPPGAFDTSTGTDLENTTLNAMNATGASLLRSIEGLDQRWKDIGLDPSAEEPATVGVYSASHPKLFNISNYTKSNALSTCIFEKYVSDFTVIWKSNADNNSLSNTVLLNQIGLQTSVVPLKMLVNGKPGIQDTTDIWVTELDDSVDNLGFTITNNKITKSNTSIAFMYVTARYVGTSIILKVHARSLWKSDEVLYAESSIDENNELILFSFVWEAIQYDSNYFLEEVFPKGNFTQTAAQVQIVIADIRNHVSPYKSHPQLFEAKGTIKMWYPANTAEFSLFFEEATVANGYSDGSPNSNPPYVGKKGMMWESWRVMDGFLNIPDLSGKAPISWDRASEITASTTFGSAIHSSGGSTTKATTSLLDVTGVTQGNLGASSPNINAHTATLDYTVYLRQSSGSLATTATDNLITTTQHNANNAIPNTATEKDAQIALSNHTHQITDSRPPYQSFVFLIKT